MAASGHKTHDARDGEGENKSENDRRRSDCIFNYFQEKHKCMIIYAVTFITLVELIYLLLQNGGGSSEKLIELMSKYLNRTNKYMK